MARLPCLAAALALAAACGDDGAASSDAAMIDAFQAADGGPPRDADSLTWVDFSATGCQLISEPAADAGVPQIRCVGPAPLTVRFDAVAPAMVDTYVWTLDADTMVKDVAPEHTYLLPGSYDVTLAVAGPGGVATATHPGFIVVEPAALGAHCTVDAQCDGSCLCGDGHCPPGFDGSCARPCGDDCNTGGGTCAQLDGASWCLPACPTTCPDGRSCQIVAGVDGWTQACLPTGALADAGGSCVDGSGGLDAQRCALGSCLDLGARGLCSAACDADHPCPDGSACATFPGFSACLARCDQPTECDADPWLTCVAPGGPGALGFTVAEDPASTYCAPRPCVDPVDCGDDGACVDHYCARR